MISCNWKEKESDVEKAARTLIRGFKAWPCFKLQSIAVGQLTETWRDSYLDLVKSQLTALPQWQLEIKILLRLLFFLFLSSY